MFLGGKFGFWFAANYVMKYWKYKSFSFLCMQMKFLIFCVFHLHTNKNFILSCKSGLYALGKTIAQIYVCKCIYNILSIYRFLLFPFMLKSQRFLKNFTVFFQQYSPVLLKLSLTVVRFCENEKVYTANQESSTLVCMYLIKYDI